MQRRILVAEDQTDLRELIVAYLQGEGYVVDQADTGTSALAAAHANAPDVLILDINMPVRDGSELLSTWTRSPSLSNVPVLLESASSDLSNVAEQFAVRATLAKPFDLDVLGAVVQQLLVHPDPPPDAGINHPT